jgi:hypothetical protein
VGFDIVNAECLMTNGMARTERCRNRARTTITARGIREMVVVVVVVVVVVSFRVFSQYGK